MPKVLSLAKKWSLGLPLSAVAFSSPALAQQPATYVVATNCAPLTGVTVTTNIEQDLVGEAVTCPSGASGAAALGSFSFQLNATSPASQTSPEWQQYVYEVGVFPNASPSDPLIQLGQSNPFIGAWVETWTITGGKGTFHNSAFTNLVSESDPNFFGFTLVPHGTSLGINLSTVGNSVSSALFQIGNASTSIAISSLQPLGSPEPIYVMTLDVVGPGNGCTTQFASGAGTITFSANQQLAFSASNFPSQCAGVNIGNQVTAEQAANIAYGTPQISASGTTVTQSFWASSGWVQLGGGGRGSNIAAGDGVHPWLTSSDGLHHIYYWNGTNWQQTNGSALNIAAYYSSTPQGNFAFPVIVGTNNRAYYVPQNPWTSGGTGELTFNWQEDPSGSFFSGSSLSAAGGTNFVGGPRILTNAYTFATGGVSGGYFSLFFNSTADGPFSKLPSDAFWISTGPDESALFALDGVGNLFTWYQGAWTDLGSNVSQVAAGTDEVYFYISNGAVFAAGGTFAAPEQLSWGSNMPLGTPPLQPTWANLPAPAANDPAAWGTRMSVGANGTLWVLDGEGAIWYLANPPGTGYQGVALGNP